MAQNLIERRFELYDMLRDNKFTPFMSGKEIDRLFDDRISAVAEIVEINRCMGEYDLEEKIIPKPITAAVQQPKKEGGELLDVLVSIHNELSNPRSRMFDKIRDIVDHILKAYGYEC